MGALPIKIEEKRELPDYLPARMVNEFAYCPRLFFYEWVEGLFAESIDTVEGSIQHRRVDANATPLGGSAKWPGCSVVGIRLPDETWRAGAEEVEEAQQLALFDVPRRKPVKRAVRPMVTPRSELRPLYLNSQGVKLGKSGAV